MVFFLQKVPDFMRSYILNKYYFLPFVIASLSVNTDSIFLCNPKWRMEQYCNQCSIIPTLLNNWYKCSIKGWPHKHLQKTDTAEELFSSHYSVCKLFKKFHRISNQLGEGDTPIGFHYHGVFLLIGMCAFWKAGSERTLFSLRSWFDGLCSSAFSTWNQWVCKELF
jgi:hypothetical protein